MSHEGASLLKKHTHIQSLFCPFRALCFFFGPFFLPDIWWSVWSQSSFRNVTKIRALDSFQSKPLLTSREGPLIVSRPREDLITVKTGTIDCGVELEPDNVESVSEFGMKRANGKGKELITADERFPPPRFVLCLVASWHFRFVVNIGGQMWKKNLHVSSLRWRRQACESFSLCDFSPSPHLVDFVKPRRSLYDSISVSAARHGFPPKRWAVPRARSLRPVVRHLMKKKKKQQIFWGCLKTWSPQITANVCSLRTDSFLRANKTLWTQNSQPI